MKSHYLQIITMLLSFIPFLCDAQSLSYSPSDSVFDSGVVCSSLEKKAYIYITNNLGSDLDAIEYTVLSIDTPNGWDVSICSYEACQFNPLEDNTYGFVDIQKDSTESIKVGFYSNGINGCGIVRVYLFDSNNPSFGDTLTFEYCCSFPSSLNEQPNKYFNIYPNPFRLSTTLEMVSEPHTLILYDLLGNKVREEQVIGKTTIERGDLTRGVYLLNLRSESQTYSAKLVVEY